MQKQFLSYFISACALLVLSTAAGWSSMSSWVAFTSILVYLFILGAIIGVGRGQADWHKLGTMTMLIAIAVSGSFMLAKLATTWEWVEFAQIGWIMACGVGLFAYTMFVGRQNAIFAFLFILSTLALFNIPDLVINPHSSQSLSSASFLTYICWFGGLGAGLLGGYGRRIKERAEAMIMQGS